MKIISPTTLLEVLEHPGVEIDKEYDVLSILVDPDRGAKFRVFTADGTPAVFDAAMFTTTQEEIPSNWVVRVREGGVVQFGPAPWLEVGFWERYFDRDPQAVAQFNLGVQRLYDSDS